MRTVSNTNCIFLQPEQRLHDVADQLPTGAGIHFINAATGVGKTYHMTTSANDNYGACIFPVKAILKQETLSARKSGKINLKFIQIEKLTSFDFSSVKELHIDECQIMYSGGFRKQVETLIEKVVEQSKRIPVYLYSATCDLNLFPVKPDTITNVVGQFKRTLNVVQIKSVGKVFQNIKYIVATATGVIEEENKPVLLFVNSKTKSDAVSRHLADRGISSIVCTSATISETGSPASIAYEKMIDTSTVAAGGYQVVIATNCLAEGINFNDDIHVVSTQCEAGLLFQQHGRARKAATHWMIAGEGTDRLEVRGNQLIHTGDGVRSVVRMSESSLEDGCKWVCETNRGKAELYSLIAEHSSRGCFGVSILNKMNEHGYDCELVELDGVEALKALKNISRKALLKVIEAHGLPRSVDQYDHPLVIELSKTRDPVEFEGPLADAIEWHSEWDAMQAMGIRGDCWQVYSKINALGRKWLVVMLRDISKRDTVSTVVDEYKKQLTRTRISGAVLDEITDAFWMQLMPSSIEWKWHTPEQTTMRRNLFRFVMGFVLDEHDNWMLPAIRAGWDVPLSSAENNRFKAREKTITGAGYTTGAFCNATGHTKKTIADATTKTIKQQVADLAFLSI